jgi:coatomer subunit beta
MSHYHLISNLTNTCIIKVFLQIRSVNVHRKALWILGEYGTSKEDIETVMARIRSVLGELPLVEAENKRQAGDKPAEEEEANQTTPAQLVTSDGTYATQSSFSTSSAGIKFKFNFLVRFPLFAIGGHILRNVNI